jgi:hypothetical protein
MNQPSLAHLSTDELVDLFEKNAIEQDRVTFKEQVSKYKTVFGDSDVIDSELENRGPDALRALTRLYNNSNMQVRLRAASMTVGVAPAEAQSVLLNIARFGHVPQSANARAKLRRLGVEW